MEENVVRVDRRKFLGFGAAAVATITGAVVINRTGVAQDSGTPEASPAASPDASPAASPVAGAGEFTVNATELAFEPKEAGIMTRPPREPDQSILTRALLVRILLVSTLLVAGAWWLFEWELARGASLAEARTAALNLFVVVEAFYLFSCRSLTRSAWRIGLFSNRFIIIGVTVQAIAQFAITYLPAMNAVFGSAPIGAEVWLRLLFSAERESQ